MLEGASPLSDRSASSRKSEEVITDEPHAGKLARVVLAGVSLRYLITLLLLAAGAPLLTIAHLFRNNLFRRDNFTYFCQILLLLSTAVPFRCVLILPNKRGLMLLNPLY